MADTQSAPDDTTHGERVGLRLARLQSESLRMRSRVFYVAAVATAARKLAKQNADRILTLGASRNAVAPLWCIAGLLAVLCGLVAALLFF